MKNALFSLAAAIFATAFTSSVAYASTPSDIHIKPDGTFTATNVVVMQKAGTANFFGRVTWNDAFVRLVILAHDSTAITKEHGEVSVSNDIQEGDTLDVTGTLVGGDGALTINATSIRDHALVQESKTFSGIIKSINPTTSSFLLQTKTGTTTVIVNYAVTIQKGARTISFGDLVVGDKVLSTSGTYDFPSNTLTASSLSIYQDKSVFLPRNFQGTLKAITASTTPTALTVTIGPTDYTVYLTQKTAVLNNRKASVALSRFVLGDTVRAFGSIRPTNLTEIDATIVRDTDF